MTSSLPSPLYLYQARLNNAMVYVTHNVGINDDVYSGNLALHVNDDKDTVLHRRFVLQQQIGKPIQWLNQVHGTQVYSIDFNKNDINTIINNDTPIADAVVSNHRDIALAIMTADCLPVVLLAYNHQGDSAIGVAHAGWRGLCEGVLQNTCKALHDLVPYATLQAHFAPCIGVAQFEVGEDVYQSFLKKNNCFNVCFIKNMLKTDKYLCDLTRIARLILNLQGIHNEHITGGGFCTVSDPRLASFRRSSQQGGGHNMGRFATVVAFN